MEFKRRACGKVKEITAMDIMEKTRELGEMIQSSAEMEKVKAAEIAQNEDAEAQKLLQEFNLARMNLVRDMNEGKITKEEAVQKNNENFDRVGAHGTIAAYIQAKKEFDEMVNQVNSILNYYITGQDPSCTHDCHTCGGCH